MHRNDVMKWAIEYHGDLLATDKRFQGSVLLTHQDGSVLFYNNAFAIQRPGHLTVFTEHHKFHVYDDTDLVSFRALGPRQVVQSF